MSQVRALFVLAVATSGLSIATRVHASAIVASDSASNSPYISGASDTATTEFNGLNGGTGFGAWIVTDVETPPGSGATTSSPTGNGGAFINSITNDATRNPAPVFDAYDNGNPSSGTATGATLGSSIETATRPFLTPLTGGGSSFSFIESLANGRPLPTGASATPANATCQMGIELLDSSGNALLNLFIFGGAPGWFVQDASNSGNPYELMSTDSAHSGVNSRPLDYNFNASDTITISLSDDSGDYTITTTGHRGDTFADGGQIDMSTGGPAAFAIYNNNGGTGSDLRVNGLTETLVPEPASWMLSVLGLCGLLLLRRQR